MGALSTAEVRGVLEFLEVACEVDGIDPFPDSVLAALRRLIPAEIVSYGDYNRKGAGWRQAVHWHGLPQRDLTPSIREAHLRFTHQKPHPPWARNAGRAVRWSDLLSRSRLQRLDVYAEVGRPLGLEYTLELWVLTPDGVAGGLAFDRSERDFSERDVCVLETLRPHLVQLWRNARLHRPGADSLFTSADSLLTRREREVLAWVARGKTNREIATVLCLAPGTVRKHLDNAYAKLDVGSRAGAVARAFLN
ncbi:MAG: LuxR C-terminal-related transcriptional regulator [Actinomycetota bacterium]|nr:LuxR C-terminal-related transcriptional regulator [Actinomycetota bacterium]